MLSVKRTIWQFEVTMPDKKQVKSFVDKSSFKHPAALSEAEEGKGVKGGGFSHASGNSKEISWKRESKKKGRQKAR